MEQSHARIKCLNNPPGTGRDQNIYMSLAEQWGEKKKKKETTHMKKKLPCYTSCSRNRNRVRTSATRSWYPPPPEQQFPNSSIHPSVPQHASGIPRRGTQMRRPITKPCVFTVLYAREIYPYYCLHLGVNKSLSNHLKTNISKLLRQIWTSYS